jgi:glycosyltransferase involved in cell wall biosynthesis
MRLTVVIPVFNEIATLEELLARVDAVVIDKEVIIVDDCSTDGTRELLKSMNQSNRVIVLHDSNAGKGAALRTGFRRARGDYVIVQDADLEYDPHDYVRLVAEASAHEADVVYGTRFAGARPQMTFKNWLGNRVLTWLTNRLYGSALSDMETCYKVIRRDVLADLTIESNRFNVEPELTAKLLMRGTRILEVPISYVGRTRAEGKKISWLDFVSAVWTLLRLRGRGGSPLDRPRVT